MEIEGEHTTAEVKLPEDEIEDSLKGEMKEMVDHKAFTNPVKFMPDTHGGLGPHAIVGFSMPLGNRVIPNTVGGDVGCGMTAARLDAVEVDFDDIEDLRSVNEEVRNRVAMGTGRVNQHTRDFEEMYPMFEADEKLMRLHDYLNYEKLGHNYYKDQQFDSEYVEELFRKVGISKKYARNSLGSLGSGNHFIEVAKSEQDGSVWVVVHSGSRNLGQKVKAYHQERATELRDGEVKWDEMTDEQARHALPDGSPDWEKIRETRDGDDILELGESIEDLNPDTSRNKMLDYLEGIEMYEYLKDMVFTQVYATQNRRKMISEVADALDAVVTEKINSPHNYVDFEDGVIRKGSTRALEGERFVIPMNMEDGTLLCRGKGNKKWNYSAPHGAGRLGSRGWAHDQFDADEVRKRMYDNGTYSASVPTDEVPEAYKDTQLIERQIEPTADVVDRLVPVMNFKA